MSKRRTAILISGRGSNMASLIEAAKEPSFPAEIVLVLSNKPEAPGLFAAKAQGINVAAVDHKIYAGRAAFEASLQKMLLAHRIDFICLAGFMRLLTPSFVTHWEGRLINIHPSLLPSYKGLDTHERAIADGVKIHGCTVHYVVAEMDAGPIIAQAAVTVLDDDTPATLGARVLEQEHIIYPLALNLAAGRSLKINNLRVTGAKGVARAMVSPHIP
ncbi:MAG: phosphoribosylglycinamide formyltransferase [Beijerinckiaceae bacterium]|nr:phosphoribosylglycinamide formyltransferase [Beijerinckiaceae bacterium]